MGIHSSVEISEPNQPSKSSVCIVSFPLTKGAYVSMSNIVELTARSVERVYVITNRESLQLPHSYADRVNVYEVNHVPRRNPLSRVLQYGKTQLAILGRVLAVSTRTNIFIFFIAGETLLPSILLLRLMGKTVVLKPGGVFFRVAETQKNGLLRLLKPVARIALVLANKIVLYSESMAREEMFRAYRSKVIIADELYQEFGTEPRKPINQRQNAIGYVGRLSEEKGILQLVEALPQVANSNGNVKVIICGEGSLMGAVRQAVSRYDLTERVRLTGWIPRQEVLEILRDLRLLVLPSFTEGSPKVLLEAMANGTPVLATRVGTVPDIVTDGLTGFLLDSNDPGELAAKIAQSLQDLELLQIVSENAENYVKANYTLEKRRRIWGTTLSQLLSPDAGP